MANISKGRTFFLLSELLVICLSSCHIVKRKAPDGKLYVFSDREGCVSVQSQAPCTLSWQLHTYLAKIYTQQNEEIAKGIQSLKNLGASDGCAEAFGRLICSQIVPKCSALNGTNDYGNVSKLCHDVYLSCPEVKRVQEMKSTGFCNKTFVTGKHKINSPCVAPSEPITGICPQPRFKMPSVLLEDYKKKSDSLVESYRTLRNGTDENGKRIFSHECVSEIEEISCTPLYCSANESQLLIKHDREDCHKTISKCFYRRFQKIAEQNASLATTVKELRHQLELACDTYPASSTQLQAEPPTVIISSGNCQFGHPIMLAAMVISLFVKTSV